MKNRLKKLILIGVVIMDISTLTACVQERAGFVTKELEEKYGIEFVAKEIGNTSMGNSGTNYTVYCVPDEDPDMVFKVEVRNDKEINDDYEEALMNKKIDQLVNNTINDKIPDYKLLTVVKNNADGFDKDTDVKSFVNEKKTKIDVMLIINTDEAIDMEPMYLYPAMEKICTDIGSFEGSFNLYFADQEAMNNIYELTEKNPGVSSMLLRECGDGFNTLVNDGVMVKTQDELIEALY